MERHPLDLFSLIPGLLFTAIGLAFLVLDVELLRVDLDWVWPLLLIALGVAVLASAQSGASRRADRNEPDDGEDPPAP